MSLPFLTIDRANADLICKRLEFDASWDKAGPGYYDLIGQLKFHQKVELGSFVPYGYDSFLLAMHSALDPAQNEDRHLSREEAFDASVKLLDQISKALEDRTNMARLIAYHPAILEVPEVSSDGKPLMSILHERVLSMLRTAFDGIIAVHLDNDHAPVATI